MSNLTKVTPETFPAVVIGGDPGYWYLTWDYRTKGMSAEFIYILAGPFKRRGQADNALADYLEERNA